MGPRAVGFICQGVKVSDPLMDLGLRHFGLTYPIETRPTGDARSAFKIGPRHARSPQKQGFLLGLFRVVMLVVRQLSLELAERYQSRTVYLDKPRKEATRTSPTPSWIISNSF